MHPNRRVSALCAALSAFVFALAGCSSAPAPESSSPAITTGPSGSSAPTQTPGPSPSATSATSTAAATESVSDAHPWRHRDAAVSNPAGGQSQITGLRYAQHDEFDRAVIEFRGPMPGWNVTYISTFHYAGSGRPVPIGDQAGVQLTLTGTAHTEAGRNLYVGPRVARPGFDVLSGVAFIGDFEGTVSFGFSLRHRAPYRIFALANPGRLVLDFQKSPG